MNETDGLRRCRNRVSYVHFLGEQASTQELATSKRTFGTFSSASKEFSNGKTVQNIKHASNGFCRALDRCISHATQFHNPEDCTLYIKGEATSFP